MNFTHIVFSFPHEARYSCDPASYGGGDIEEYETVTTAVTLGDRILQDGRLWTVAELNEYAPVGHNPVGHNKGTFTIAIATLDGSSPQREVWDDAGEHYFYVLTTDEKGLTEGLPARLEEMPQVGESPLGYEDYEIADVMGFEPVGSYRQGFDRVQVCVCVPVGAELGVDAGAIAA